MLDNLRSYFGSFPSNPEEIDLKRSQAAVLIALTDSATDPSIVLTRRSDTLSTHSGEVSLPGGRRDAEDASLLHTALRESDEEIGLKPDAVEILGALPNHKTGRGMDVYPFVGVIPEGYIYTPNPQELDAIFHVPVSFFAADERIRTDRFERSIGPKWSPAYRYQGFEIWGFTARLLVNFLSDALDIGFSMDNPAPVKCWDSAASTKSAYKPN